MIRAARDVDTVDKARADARFQQGQACGIIPHAAYALRLHLMLCLHYQAAIWEMALKLQSALSLSVLSLRDGG